ncbi:MAG: LCP family protein [Bacillota bacterium]|nr:LCP family protein [Bacillota bacterium]
MARLEENSRKSNIIRLIVLIIIAVLVLACLGIIYVKEHKAPEIDETYEPYEEEANLVRYDGKWYKQNPDLTTLLLIGVDNVKTEDESVSKQSDFLLVVAINNKNKTYEALQINRDTLADVPQLDIYGDEFGSEIQQIALAYTHGDTDLINCRNTAKAVSNLLYGVEIKDYIGVTMDAVPIVNDLVGGVPVYVEDDFSGSDPSIRQGETITLMGDQALHFVRARGSMQEPTNIARMERQRVYMNSLHEKAIAKAKEDSNFITDSLLKINSYITSNCTVSEMANLFDIALNQESSEIMTIKGEAVMGDEYMEYHVDEEALQKQIIDMFFIEN